MKRTVKLLHKFNVEYHFIRIEPDLDLKKHVIRNLHGLRLCNLLQQLTTWKVNDPNYCIRLKGKLIDPHVIYLTPFNLSDTRYNSTARFILGQIDLQ
jgi:hypothetical protein